jgi:hypothetical protein
MKAHSPGQTSTVGPLSPNNEGPQPTLANEYSITDSSSPGEAQILFSSASAISYRTFFLDRKRPGRGIQRECLAELIPTPAQIVPTISPIERILNVSRSASQQTPPVETPLAQQAPKRHIFELEEFEVRRNDIFDIVTRSSLNDRAELEKLLS